MRAEWVKPAHAAGLCALFERAESPCFCRWWHFSGDKNAWLDRSANHTHENRRELETALADQSAEASGIVALAEDDRVVGWMKLAPASAMSKLYAQRLYRALPVFGDRDRVYAIGCFLVDPAWRHRGIARLLVETAIAEARSRGVRAIEAFPRVAQGVPDEQLWTGPISVFTAAGFVAVHDAGPYPVLRYAFE